MEDASGERERCEALIARYGGYVYAIVSRVAGNRATREDVEECAADALLALLTARDRYDSEKGDLKPYVAAIARNKAVKLRERLSRSAPFLPLDEDILELDVPDPPAQYEQAELEALLGEAVRSLGPPDPEIFERQYYWGEALSDIARALGLTERAVEGRLYRGRRQLKAYLEGRL
ncbi:MAG: sigma-70 family RNA polymerase sigma factor [Christensenellaceae bacterium]|nr:sigma-70 family RNA polymerase sigma factor [Christensenellaceae bacterium]